MGKRGGAGCTTGSEVRGRGFASGPPGIAAATAWRGACRGGTRQDVGSDLGGHVPCPASVSSSASHVVARALHR